MQGVLTSEFISRHTVHPFPARMAANIPWEVLNRGSNQRQLRVLDPMMGSGTSLIVGRAAGHSTYGFDSDPLAVLIAKVGTANTVTNRIEDSAHRALRRARRMNIPGTQAYPSNADEETREFARYWFDLDARKQLTALSRAIHEVSDASLRKFLWCALSRMIITKDTGVSLARDVSHSRPHRSFSRSPVKPFDAFEMSLQRVLRGCLFKGDKRTPDVKVWQGDARQLPLETESIDLVITSPPYLNAIDYMRGHKLSLVWMGHQIKALRGIRGNSVGAESGNADPPKTEFASVVRAMGHLERLPERFRRMIERYVDDMNAVMTEISRVLVPRGQAVMVLGDCTLRGIYIRNSIAIRMLAVDCGMTLISERRRRIPDKRRYLPPPQRKSGEALAKRIRTEVILSFRKSVRHE
jgi:tRNA G10  N-methylase Trm11